MKIALKKGQVFSERQFYTVIKTSGDKVQLLNDRGENIVVDNDYIEMCLESADIFSNTKKVTRTEIADLLIRNQGVAMTVNFNEKLKEEDVLSAIDKGAFGVKTKLVDKAINNIKERVKVALKGNERTMKGRHSGDINEFGRISFIDMEIEKDVTKGYDNRTRQVDPRTVNWLIVNGIKYELKK